MNSAVENTPMASLADVSLHSARRLYLVSTFFAASGRNAYYVGAAWIMINSTKDPGAVAVFFGLGSVAEFIAAAPAGYLTDRFNRRLLCVLCDVARILILLATCAALSLGRADHALFVSVVLYSLIDRIYLTCVPTLIPLLAPAHSLLLFNALAYIGMQVGNLLAAVAVGLLLDMMPEQVCILVAVGAFMTSLLCMSLVSSSCTVPISPQSQLMAAVQKPVSPRSRCPLSPLLIVSYALVYAMGMLFSVLASTFVLQELAGTAADFGALESGWAAGAIVGAALLTLNRFNTISGSLILPILMLSGITLAAFHVPPNWLVILLQAALLGAGHTLARVLIEVEIQRKVPNCELGRAKATIHLACMCLSLILYGILILFGKWLAPSTSFLTLGVFMITYATALCVLNMTRRSLTDRRG